jgi:hypothetical protein
MTWANVIEEFSVGDNLGNFTLNVLRNPLWRDGGMTPQHTSNGSHRARGWHDGRDEAWPLLERLVACGLNPAELAGLPPSRAARVTALARRARFDEAAALSVLGLLAPELTAIRRRLVAEGIEPDEAEALAISVGWEVLSRRRRHPQPRSLTSLVEVIWRAARHEAGIRRCQVETVPLVDCLDAAATEVDPLEHWPGLLAASVATGVLSPRQVVILAQSRMDERPLAEVARALGRPYDALRMERRRAEKALREFALSYDWPTS